MLLSNAATQYRLLSTMTSLTPMADIIRKKVQFSRNLPMYCYIVEAFKPTDFQIHNDSHLHAHHEAMAGSTSRETHFRLSITSDAFSSKMQPARHRMVYALMKEELAREGGIHALQLKTQTPEEAQALSERESTNGAPKMQ
ncbi:BolA domain UV inducedv protein Uvi31 [Blumeria hordei DH14]|uniref:BolA domain UV inducedv protein Uvi31 n=1 Tax=Blumeria graminis f. sp. hordei (strain DH14) TaxID=546991 RepID=N1JI18_BLUG1|nr:BolA domain UV inducedv protein Uvi31 [Blumeria hordei DH14]